MGRGRTRASLRLSGPQASVSGWLPRHDARVRSKRRADHVGDAFQSGRERPVHGAFGERVRRATTDRSRLLSNGAALIVQRKAFLAFPVCARLVPRARAAFPLVFVDSRPVTLPNSSISRPTI